MNSLDFIIAIPPLILFIIGYRKGIIVGTFNFLGIVLGFIVATFFSSMIMDKVLHLMDLPQIFSRFSYFIVYFVTFVGVRFIGYRVKKGASFLGLRGIDKFIGGVFGFFQAFIPIVLVLIFLNYVKILPKSLVECSKLFPFVRLFYQGTMGYFIELFPKLINYFHSL